MHRDQLLLSKVCMCLYVESGPLPNAELTGQITVVFPSVRKQYGVVLSGKHPITSTLVLSLEVPSGQLVK